MRGVPHALPRSVAPWAAAEGSSRRRKRRFGRAGGRTQRNTKKKQFSKIFNNASFFKKKQVLLKQYSLFPYQKQGSDKLNLFFFPLRSLCPLWWDVLLFFSGEVERSFDGVNHG